MKIIRSITAFNSSEKTIVTIGTFDGIHIGHQKILKDLIKTAKKEGKKSNIFFIWRAKQESDILSLTHRLMFQTTFLLI